MYNNFSMALYIIDITKRNKQESKILHVLMMRLNLLFTLLQCSMSHLFLSVNAI